MKDIQPNQIIPNTLASVDKDGNQTWVGSVDYIGDDGKTYTATRYQTYNPKDSKPVDDFVETLTKELTPLADTKVVQPIKPVITAAQSAPGSLNTTDWQKIGKGALIAVGGAAVTYAAQALSSTNFGEYTPLAVAISSVLVNLGHKFFRGQ